jgi:mycothiol synthase
VIDIHLGNAAPRYVWPGIPLDLTPAVACFQSLGFTPYDHGLNMNLSTGYRAAAPAGVLVERETGDGAIELARRAYPQWVEEVTRGMTRDGTFAARDTATGETIGFACHSVNRHGWIGPMATDPERRSRGVGNALLSALSEDIAAQHGLACGEISWASPVPFYAKAGATINRTFRMARRQLGEFPG